MYNIHHIIETVLLEQDSKISTLRQAIIDRKPISIQYSGPPGEVLSGPRFDIEPVVMGINAKSGNSVIWAYVFKGVSKKGIPGWKMFRVDRIESVDPSGLTADSFKLSDLPGYERGKAPNAMKALSRVDIYSPYWFEDYKKYAKKPVQPPPPQPRKPEPRPEPAPQPPEAEVPVPTEPEVPTSPDLSRHRLDTIVFNELRPKAREVNGQKIISTQDYTQALDNLRRKKEDEWKNYQKMVTGNVRPGEGTRKRFEITSKNELDALLSKNGISVSDTDENMIAEIEKRFKRLIIS